MIYLTGSVGVAVEPALDAGRIGYLRAPGGGRSLTAGWVWAADNGSYGKGWPGYEKWLAWLESHTPEERTRCLFATAPDVVGDAAATLKRSLPWLPAIRSLGYPAALVTQDGMTPDMIPWNDVDWLFIGGTDAHKLGPEAKTLITAARSHGKHVHVGRVNSQRRLLAMSALGVDSVDGTYLAFGPEVNLPRLLGWLTHEETHEPLFTL
jgi:hypothetical protein